MADLNFSPLQLDALKEIGNVGAGNAATALGQLMNKLVSINIPEAKFLRLDQLDNMEFFKEPQEISIAIYSRILGTLRGGVLVLFSKKNSLLLSDILLKRKPGSNELLTLIELSAISETAYILCCSYLDSVGHILNHHPLIPSSSHTAIDKMSSLNKILIKKIIGEDVKYIMSIENKMCIENIEIDLFVALLLEHASTKKIFEILGL